MESLEREWFEEGLVCQVYIYDSEIYENAKWILTRFLGNSLILSRAFLSLHFAGSPPWGPRLPWSKAWIWAIGFLCDALSY